MSSHTARIPSSSQTVGPYFRIGLDCLIERTPAARSEAPGIVTIEGRVFDRDDAPVPDAMLEFWCAAIDPSAANTEAGRTGCPAGFRRVATGSDGEFSVIVERPPLIDPGCGSEQAPHFMVMVFARGLLRQLLTRVYVGGPPCGETDTVLSRVPKERRETLIAAENEHRRNVFHWNVKLQGTGETVFFAW